MSHKERAGYLRAIYNRLQDKADHISRTWTAQDRALALAVPICSPLSCRSRIGELLPFTHSLVCKILITAGFVA
jgi:hypothetical protein